MGGKDCACPLVWMSMWREAALAFESDIGVADPHEGPPAMANPEVRRQFSMGTGHRRLLIERLILVVSWKDSLNVDVS